MLEYQPQSIATIIKPSTGETIISKADIITSSREKYAGFIAMGFTDRVQKELSADERGVAYVEMNTSGRMSLEQAEDGVIATSSLAGCTGVAGFARRKDGGIATFVSHYDPMSQDSKFTGKDTPVNNDLYSFRYHAGRKAVELDGPVLYLVAYTSSEHHCPDYGQKMGVFKDWNYLDQINTTATQLGNNAQVLLLPYEMSQGHTLASGRADGQEGIFWDGVKINFDTYSTSSDLAITV